MIWDWGGVNSFDVATKVCYLVCLDCRPGRSTIYVLHMVDRSLCRILNCRCQAIVIMSRNCFFFDLQYLW